MAVVTMTSTTYDLHLSWDVEELSVKWISTGTGHLILVDLWKSLPYDTIPNPDAIAPVKIAAWLLISLLSPLCCAPLQARSVHYRAMLLSLMSSTIYKSSKLLEVLETFCVNF